MDYENFESGLNIDGTNEATQLKNDLLDASLNIFKGNMKINGTLYVDEEVINTITKLETDDPILEVNAAQTTSENNKDVGWTGKHVDNGLITYQGAIFKKDSDNLIVYNKATINPNVSGLTHPYDLATIQVRDASNAQEPVTLNQLNSLIDLSGVEAQIDLKANKDSPDISGTLDIIHETPNGDFLSLKDNSGQFFRFRCEPSAGVTEMQTVRGNKELYIGSTNNHFKFDNDDTLPKFEMLGSSQISMNNNKILNLADASENTDAVNLQTLNTKISEIDLDPNSYTFQARNSGNDNLIELDFTVDFNTRSTFTLILRYSATADDGSPVLDQRKGVYSFVTRDNQESEFFDPVYYFGQVNDEIFGVKFDTTGTTKKIKIYAKSIVPTQEGVKGVIQVDLINVLYTITDSRIIDVGDKNTVVPGVPSDVVVAMKVDISNASSNSLPTAGGSMSGNINMTDNRILGLNVTPTSTSEATSKQYVDGLMGSYLHKAGGTMTGQINMGGNRIVNAGNPINTNDVVTKTYAEDNFVAKTNPVNIENRLDVVGNNAQEIRINSFSGSSRIMQELHFITHASNRGGGLIWSDDSDSDREMFFGKAYQGGSTIDGFVINTTTSGQDVFDNGDYATCALRILDNRNIGIGTPSPTKKLDVQGDTIVRGDLDVTGDMLVDGIKRFCYINGSVAGVTVNRDFVVRITLGTSDFENSLVAGKTYLCSARIIVKSSSSDQTYCSCKVNTVFGNSLVHGNPNGFNLGADPLTRNHVFNFNFVITTTGSGTVNPLPSLVLAKALQSNVASSPSGTSDITYFLSFRLIE